MVKRARKKTGKIEFENIIWVIDNLTAEEIDRHDKKPYTPQEILDNSMLMIDDGFRVTCKFDLYSKSYMATATCMEQDKDNSGLAIAARGNDIADCLSIVQWKYIVMAERDLRGFTDKVPTGVRG